MSALGVPCLELNSEVLASPIWIGTVVCALLSLCPLRLQCRTALEVKYTPDVFWMPCDADFRSCPANLAPRSFAPPPPLGSPEHKSHVGKDSVAHRELHASFSIVIEHEYPMQSFFWGLNKCNSAIDLFLTWNDSLGGNDSEQKNNEGCKTIFCCSSGEEDWSRERVFFSPPASPLPIVPPPKNGVLFKGRGVS